MRQSPSTSLPRVGFASYYLCRVNFAAAQPLILTEFPAWTNAQIGGISSTYAVAYSAGHVVNDTLGERCGARRQSHIEAKAECSDSDAGGVGRRKVTWKKGLPKPPASRLQAICLGGDCDPQATHKPPTSHPQATYMRPSCDPHATLMRPSCDPHATFMRPPSHPQQAFNRSNTSRGAA
jgi:hypothetical protein